MKDQLALLRELQAIDLELDEIGTRKNEILARLSENTSFLEKLVLDLDTQKEELDEVRQVQAEKKADLEEIKEQLSERQKRMRDVGSTKEYNAVEKEVEMLKKSAEQTEEELLQLMEAIESTEKATTEKEAKIVQLRESIAADEADAEGELTDLDKSIAKAEKRQKQARESISRRVMAKYDFIRSRRPGLAIVAAKHAHCEGCFMALPAQQYIEIQRGDTLETCPSCNRILYFFEDALAEESSSQAVEA